MRVCDGDDGRVEVDTQTPWFVMGALRCRPKKQTIACEELILCSRTSETQVMVK